MNPSQRHGIVPSRRVWRAVVGGLLFLASTAWQAGAGPRPVRIIDGTTIVGDSDPALWKSVLDVLPVRPRRIELLDLEALSDHARAKLRGLDAFVLAGQATIVVIRQGATLRQAALGDGVDRLMLASLVWHEMAHANGADESAAFAAEEALWRRFISTGRVPSDVGMAYVSRLRETAARGSEVRPAIQTKTTTQAP